MNATWKGRRSARFLSLALAPLAVTALAAAQQTTRASVDSLGHEGDDDSSFPVLSRDGRFVVFQSDASNLVPGDANSNMDVFVHDRLTGVTRQVSVSSLGAGGDGPSREPVISADGRFVAFTSDATNLVPGDTNAGWDVFVRDLVLETTVRASVDSFGQQVNGLSGLPSISADGRYVAFSSTASALVPGDTNTFRDVFVRDLVNGVTERVSIATGGAQAQSGLSDTPSISGSGQFIAFTSAAANLVVGDTNNATDVFVHDRINGTTLRASISSAGAQASVASFAPALSLDGSAVVFQSNASTLVSGDTNNTTDVFLHDLVLGTTERVSRGFNSAQPNGPSTRPSIAGDGTKVLFQSSASNLVTPDANGPVPDQFLFDRTTGTTTLVALSFDDRQIFEGSEFGTLAVDGLVIAFTSLANKYVPNDGNVASDVFVRDLLPLPAAPVAFCNADADSTPCPCGNSGPNGLLGGCQNSLGLFGALLCEGTPRISLDSLRFTGVNLPNSSALLLQGTARENGGLGVVLGDGLLCVGGSIVRLGSKPVASNSASFPVAGEPTLSTQGSVLPGDVKTYQLWYRNSAAYCSSATYNLTNAWEVVWGP
ncbi:MAG: PD40 domain-containing protein [Planctomycetes bacterium]|nr:PD40 domain-containing protein [Planctomycetota bacterium]